MMMHGLAKPKSVYTSAFILGYRWTVVATKKAAARMYNPLSSDVISSKTSDYFHIKHPNKGNGIHSTGYVPTTRF